MTITAYVGDLPLLPLTNFVTVDADTNIGSALSRTKSSHEGIFIFDRDRFLGMVCAHGTLFRSRYPYLSKVSSCVFVPPFIKTNSPLWLVAEHMIFSNIYTLPVFAGVNEIAGVITAGSILSYIADKDEIIDKIAVDVSIHPPVVARTDTTVGDVYRLMRGRHVARIPLVNEKGMLAAIVSWKDIEAAFTGSTVRQRYTTRKNYPVKSSFDVEPVDRRDSPIMEFATNRVVTGPMTAPKRELLMRMLRSKKHSIVIESHGIPVGFLSRHDVLMAVAHLKPAKVVSIDWTKHIDGLKEYRLKRAYGLLNRFAEKLDRRFSIKRISVMVDQPKNAAGYPKDLYKVTLHVIPIGGKSIIAKSEEESLMGSFHGVVDKILNAIEMSDRQKHIPAK